MYNCEFLIEKIDKNPKLVFPVKEIETLCNCTIPHIPKVGDRFVIDGLVTVKIIRIEHVINSSGDGTSYNYYLNILVTEVGD